MLLKLSLLLSTIGIIACNVPFDTTKEVKYEETNQIQQRNYQHSEYLNSYTEVVYKYDSNEVNSNDDLIEGNVYQFDFEGTVDELLVHDDYINLRVLYLGYIDLLDSDVTLLETIKPDYEGSFPSIIFFLNSVSLDISYYFSEDYDYFSDFYVDASDEPIKLSLICVLVNFEVRESSRVYTHFTSTAYNVIESVIYHQPQTVIGVINEFCETYLFSEIPYINSMTFDVGGQSINLMTWLVMAVGLVIGIGILIALFYLFKWLILLFAGIFKK